ncbi:host-nuclease inhibitor Gam family protein (plasmid) [Bacillus carboniphilus]|uniref:Host-nuclease inhibitor Gam family protein n=1 Tax=Bacillus carboniphilus TaxID=86663 RepID=A0ABY9K1E2_9BACI|nr:host-nuclease inhibitor Gam family protein [Bacillus carboniphilus]WLR44518.1 host-nuclease inhibitor Gam family protein [Bacillus carboniphilus]
MNPLLKTEIDDWNIDWAEEQQDEVKQRYQISGIDSLNWAFRKLSAFKAQEAEIEQLAKIEHERIEQWETQQKRGLQQDIQFFETLINEYHANVLEEDPKQKTLSTPYGRSKSRRTKCQPDKADEQALLQYIKTNDLQGFIKESVKWADLKKTLKVAETSEGMAVIDENGQVVEGAVVKPESITYKVEVD